jgi:sortase family protein
MTGTSPRRLTSVLVVIAGGLLAVSCGGGSPSSTATKQTSTSTATAPSTDTFTPTPTPSAAPAALAPLVARLSVWSDDLHSKPVAVPLRFQAPTIGVDIPMEAVGLTSKNAMDAPEASADDPVWNTGFWYRGGVEPGQPGVATIAAHLDDTLGRPAAFWNLRKLQPGDVVAVVDGRTGETIHFKVTETHVYSLADSSTRPVLDRLFGPDSAVAQPPVFPQDGISRLSLVTCAGTFTRGEYDHRYMVFAERADGPGSASTPATPTPAPTPGQPAPTATPSS